MGEEVPQRYYTITWQPDHNLDNSELTTTLMVRHNFGHRSETLGLPGSIGFVSRWHRDAKVLKIKVVANFLPIFFFLGHLDVGDSATHTVFVNKFILLGLANGIVEKLKFSAKAMVNVDLPPSITVGIL